MRHIVRSSSVSFYRRQLLDQLNLDYASLREDATAWQAELAERHILDGTLLDGLDPNEIWTEDGDSGFNHTS
jgi:hypothetical protein